MRLQTVPTTLLERPIIRRFARGRGIDEATIDYLEQNERLLLRSPSIRWRRSQIPGDRRKAKSQRAWSLISSLSWT